MNVLSSRIGTSDRVILCEELKTEGNMYVDIALREFRQLDVFLGLL